MGYRHHDGCVSYVAQTQLHTNMSNHEGRGGGVGASRPEVMLRSDYLRLSEMHRNDSQFFSIWMQHADNQPFTGFDVVKLTQALVAGTVAKPLQTAFESNEEVLEVNTVEQALEVLCLLSEPDTEECLDKRFKSLVKDFHPDQQQGKSDKVKSYAERFTKSLYDARDLLRQRIRNRK